LDALSNALTPMHLFEVSYLKTEGNGRGTLAFLLPTSRSDVTFMIKGGLAYYEHDFAFQSRPKDSALWPYLELGLDWRQKSGFHLFVGLSSIYFLPLPVITLGWSF